jgi:hypothetical protein
VKVAKAEIALVALVKIALALVVIAK